MALSPYIVTKGVVLRETETRDADKILTLLTAERGKLSVIARGVCRKGCKFAACAQPLAYSEWTLYKKGDWYYANEGTTLELFSGLRADLDAMALGFYLAELTEAVTTEDAPHQGLLSHLLNGLYAVSVLRKPLPLVKAAFEIKLLCLAGYEPLADACAYCGCPIPSSRISTFCRAFSAAGPAERGAGVFHCVGIHWPPCGTSFTATPSGFIPSHWDRRPKSGCPLPPKPLSPPSWSGDSGRWTSIRVSGAWMSHPD